MDRPAFAGMIPRIRQCDMVMRCADSNSGRDQKHQHEADSESTSSGLLSPRDKPTRKEVLRREEARKQRAADEPAVSAEGDQQEQRGHGHVEEPDDALRIHPVVGDEGGGDLNAKGGALQHEEAADAVIIDQREAGA